MIAMLMTQLANGFAEIATLASSSDGDGPGWLLILGPAGGAGVYFGLFNYYRNTGKSHSFEHETRIEAQPVTGGESKVRENNGTRQSHIDGDNRTDHRRRVERF